MWKVCENKVTETSQGPTKVAAARISKRYVQKIDTYICRRLFFRRRRTEIFQGPDGSSHKYGRRRPEGRLKKVTTFGVRRKGCARKVGVCGRSKGRGRRCKQKTSHNQLHGNGIELSRVVVIGAS
jgi:hypothetical protein